ncbi:MAG TPA: hypothetical protein VKV36_06655 [Acidimicrobiales bacterium]|nr:hypothetical protein [Acidimicrobiales bacterium]
MAQAVGDPAVPIHPALVFVHGDWDSGAELRILSKRPYRHLGVWVTWPRALTSMIAKPGPLTPGMSTRSASTSPACEQVTPPARRRRKGH